MRVSGQELCVPRKMRPHQRIMLVKNGGEVFLDAASLVFGILSIFMWPIQYGGFLVSATGLALGVVMLRRRKSGMAMAGIVLASIGLALTIINLKIGLLDLILKTYFQY